MKRLLGLLFFPLVLAPTSAKAYIIEEMKKERHVLGFCGSNRVEGAIYQGHSKEDPDMIQVKAYYYLNGERVPFLVYDAVSKIFSFDLNRDGRIDYQQLDKESQKIDMKKLCETISQER